MADLGEASPGFPVCGRIRARITRKPSRRRVSVNVEKTYFATVSRDRAALLNVRTANLRAIGV